MTIRTNLGISLLRCVTNDAGSSQKACTCYAPLAFVPCPQKLRTFREIIGQHASENGQKPVKILTDAQFLSDPPAEPQPEEVSPFGFHHRGPETDRRQEPLLHGVNRDACR